MHLCTAYIALGGDSNNVIHRGPLDAVSWPEIGLLQFLHGEQSVYNCEVCGEVQVRPADEKARLIGIYGDVVEAVYPGRAPALEMEMPGADVPKPVKPEKRIAGQREAAV